ncbi:hypothetical protein EJ02DRAFT_483956 [Clathrospora elynae]|uniref:Uncharacterized protein n=1 Tax=Clathrospora elynae TaxID=706981 RepID=A0A6A5SZB7_9PLEO|nr:hypothetical protein EJ02DRAFT_483956 [Clathrospora elynae]
MTYISFFELCFALRDYIEDISPTSFLDRRTTLFPTLPLELRELIYHYAILPDAYTPHSHHIDFSAADTVHSHDPHYLHWLPPLCRVNEATRVDASLFLLRITDFTLLYPAHVPSFSRFLATIPYNQGFAALRQLDFQLFSRHQPLPGQSNTYIDFMKRCPGLTKICLKLEVGYLTKVSCTEHSLVMAPTTLWVFGQTRILELEDLLAAYRLARLLELTSVNQVVIEVWPKIHVSSRFSVDSVLVDCAPLVQRVAEWLRDGFGERGRRVCVEVVEASSAGLRWRR